MKFSRFVTAATFLAVFFILFNSCSTSSGVAGSEESARKKSLVFPAWYAAGQSFIPDSIRYRGYATALAGDSAGAAQKAATQAGRELKSGISRKLESIRRKAVEELGESTGLDTPGFIMTLRNAEKSVLNVIQVANRQTVAMENNKGFRGFAGVTAGRQDLLSELNEAMSRYKTAWNAMKSSQAFSEF